MVTGADPAQTEQKATSVLENAFSQLKNIKNITSYSSYGRGSIQLVFDKGEEMANRRFEAMALLRILKQKLPKEMSFPVITLQKENNKRTFNSPLLVYTINGTSSTQEIRKIAQDLLKKKFSHIKGIKSVEVSHPLSEQLFIKYRTDKLNAYKIPQGAIENTIALLAQPVSLGYVTDEYGHQVPIQIGGKDLDFPFLENTLIPGRANIGSIRLKDLASAQVRELKTESYFRINGKNAVRISVYPREGVNVIHMARIVKSIANEIIPQLPLAYKLELTYDDTEFLSQEINKNLRRTILALAILLVFSFLFYRNWRHALNLVLTLLVNICLSIILVWLFEINIHLYTLAGIAVAFGIMVDHGIIMIDYYHQYRNRKVYKALLGATIATACSLSLTYLLPNTNATNILDFALVIIIALSCSLLTNLLFTVSVYKFCFQGRQRKINQPGVKVIKWSKVYLKIIRSLANLRKTFITSLILVFGIPIFQLPTTLAGHEWYNKSLGSDYYREQISPIVNSITGGTLRLFTEHISSSNTHKDFGKTKLLINAEMPTGSTIDQMNSIMESLEGYIGQIKGVNKYVTQISSRQNASIEILFDQEKENGPLPFQIKSLLTTKVLDWGGISWTILGVGQGFSSAELPEIPKFRVKMMGYNLTDLDRQSMVLQEKLTSNKRVQNINPDVQIYDVQKREMEYVLDIDKRKAGLAGVDTHYLFSTLR